MYFQIRSLKKYGNEKYRTIIKRIKMKFLNLKFNTFLEQYVNKTLVELNIYKIGFC